jgi:hypothetical protein
MKAPDKWWEFGKARCWFLVVYLDGSAVNLLDEAAESLSSTARPLKTDAANKRRWIGVVSKIGQLT